MEPSSSSNTLSIVLTVVGIFTAILQTLIVLVLNGIKNDIKDIWKRVYGHYHEIQCNNDACHNLKTGNVIVPGGEK